MKYNTLNVEETNEHIKAEYPVGINFLTFCGRYEKGVFDISQQKLISEDYVDASYYKGVFSNSTESPLRLHSNSRTHLYEASFLSYYSIMYYKDTGNIGINYTIKTLGLSLKNKRAFTVKKDLYTLYIEKESGKPSMFKNKKLCYTNKCLGSAFKELFTLVQGEKIKELDLLRTALEEYFLPIDSGKSPKYFYKDHISLFCLYRVKRSYRFLKDLPWNQEALFKLYVGNFHLRDEDLAKQREKILVQLRKGNTKKAVNLCFHGYDYPKSIKKILISQGPLEYPEYKYKFLVDAIDKYGVDLVRNCLLAAPNTFESLLDCIDLGFSPKHVLNVAAVDHHILRDVLRLHGMVSERVQVTFNPNLRDYHDYLDHIYRTLNPRNRNFGVDYTEVFESVDTSKEYEEVSTDKYIFRSPKTANELILVGRDLNICVGSYCKHFFVKTLDIVLVTDLENNYVGCIEINSNHVVQAKLKYNRKFSSDADVYSAMVDWMELMEVIPHTIDLGEGDFRYIPNMLPDKKRDNLLAEHLEKHRAANIEKADSMRANLVFIDETPFGNELTPF